MAHIHEETRFVTGLPASLGGDGDPSLLTAVGVLEGTKACVKAVFGVDGLAGRIIAIQGLGKVGYQLARYMIAAGARVVGADISSEAAERARASLGIPVVSPEAIYGVQADVFAPCGLGGVLDRETVSMLQAPIVAGAANNQLADVSSELALRERGFLYAPDFAINAGGLISVTAGLGAYDKAEAWQRTAHIRDTIARVIARAREQRISTRQAAQDLALGRIARRRAATAS
jgi:leucine dehydrogenase